MTAPDLPEQVRTALQGARSAGFEYSCSPGVGRLLAAVAHSLNPLAAARTADGNGPDGAPAVRIAESGTGVGVGSAWIRSGMPSQAALFTVEHDPGRAALAAGLFAGDPQVHLLTGDWTLLREHGPYDLFFCDGGGKRQDPDGVVDLLAPGGTLVLDDFAPSYSWPPQFEGAPDELRIRYLTHPLLLAAEVQTDPELSAVIAIRRF